MDLLVEEDFSELPEQPEHKWLHLQKVVFARYSKSYNQVEDKEQLSNQYITIITTLAEQFSVKSVGPTSDASVQTKFEKFQLAVERAKVRIWAAALPEYPFGRVKLSEETRDKILQLSTEIEIQIADLDASDARKQSMHKRLEEFRREINQPQTRIGAALQQLAPIATLIAMSTATLAQAPDAVATIQRLLGAEQIAVSEPEIALIQKERFMLLPSPPKQLEGPK